MGPANGGSGRNPSESTCIEDKVNKVSKQTTKPPQTKAYAACLRSSTPIALSEHYFLTWHYTSTKRT